MTSKYSVKGNEGAARLFATTEHDGARNLAALPEHALTVTDLFRGETVVFPFGAMHPNVRQELTACFTGNRSGC